jgi:hypothetical protein
MYFRLRAVFILPRTFSQTTGIRLNLATTLQGASGATSFTPSVPTVRVCVCVWCFHVCKYAYVRERERERERKRKREREYMNVS